MEVGRGGAALLLLVFACSCRADVRRVVIIKSDGLPGYMVNESLPWIKRVFLDGGARVENFYTRGISVSAPSWAVLETGRNPIIRGNVEFDRYSLRTYDYLNFFPFYFRYALSRQVDTTGVEALDDLGVPMLADVFRPEECYRGFQLFQREVRWNTLTASLRRGLSPGSMRNLVDEWLVGFQMEDSFNRQQEEELIRKLGDPKIRYLDLFHTEFDHAAHLTHDRRVLARALQSLDALVGRIWTAIEKSPLAAETALILVSDHGINNDPAVFGQGWNLVDALRSAAGGGHHVITNRHLRSDYKIRGLNPFVSQVTNESSESLYLKGASAAYPTALADLDGNERASVYLRNSDWNALQILQQQLQRRDLPDGARHAAAKAVSKLMKKDREGPAFDFEPLQQAIERMQAGARTKTIENRRLAARAQRMEAQIHDYQQQRESVSAQSVPRRSLGEPNSVYQLQNYVIGLKDGGLMVAVDGSLDWERSFRRVNYFDYFTSIEVRNVPQAAVSSHPVDFLAVSVSTPEGDGVWLYKDRKSQALILRRGELLRYLPVKELQQDPAGQVTYSLAEWRSGLPVALVEELPKEWLAEWHTEREWLRATHAGAYSNAVVSLAAQFASITAPDTSAMAADERLAREFAWRERRAAKSDLLILASKHWNFNVRGFNPGGNHGAFFRVSTNSTLLIAGGEKTDLPRGLNIVEPYDGLSFAPTVLKLAGKAEYRRLPGPLIEELYPGHALSASH